MELRQLRYFKAIADARSFARGAHQLRVAQPALSRSIANLESELGQAVFYRHSGGVSLTDAGLRLYEHATGVLRRMQRLTDEMSADLGSPHGVVSLGVPPSMQAVITAPVVGAFLKAFPNATLNVVQNTSVNLRDAVMAGHVDIAVISTMTPSRGLNYTPLATDGICVVERADTPARFGSSVSVVDLATEPLLLCGYPYTMRLFLEDAFEAARITPNVRCEVNSSSLLLDLVNEGAGTGIVPVCALLPNRMKNLRVTPINGLRVAWTIATSYERIGSASVTQLSVMLRNHVASLIESGVWPTAMAPEEPPVDRNMVAIHA